MRRILGSGASSDRGPGDREEEARPGGAPCIGPAATRALYPLVGSAFVLRYYLGEGRHAISRREFGPRRNGFWGRPAAAVRRIGSHARPLWVHAAAAGETMAAAPLLRRLRRSLAGRPLVLSHSELEGEAQARALGLDVDGLFYFPLDLPGIAGRALSDIDPLAVILVESELWPNSLWAARHRGIPVALVNAEMFDWGRQTQFPRWVRPFYGHMLQAIDVVGAKSRADARNLEALGLPPERIKITGELKVEALGPAATREEREALASELGLDGRHLCGPESLSGRSRVPSFMAEQLVSCVP